MIRGDAGADQPIRRRQRVEQVDLLHEQAVAALDAAIEALPRQRRPRETHWVDVLPRTPSGKLQRNKLIALRTEMRERMLVDS